MILCSLKLNKCNYLWLSNLLTSLATSLLFGAVLTFIFTSINNKTNISNSAKRELNEAFRNLMILGADMIPAWHDKNKNIKLVEIVERLPHLYSLKELYPKYATEYESFRKTAYSKLMNCENTDGFLIDIYEIMNKSLIIQELLHQDYFDEKKRPLYGTENGIRVEYGAKYSKKKRNGEFTL